MAISKWLIGTLVALSSASCSPKSVASAVDSEPKGAATESKEWAGPPIGESTPAKIGPTNPVKESAPQATARILTRDEEIWAAANDRVGTQVDIWFEDGEFPRAIQLLEFQSRMLPASYDVATNLGWMYENIEDNSEAIRVYRRFGDENPKDPDNKLAEAEIYFRQRKYPEVIRILEPVIGRSGLHPNNYRMLAGSYERVKNYKAAEMILTKYLKLHPDDLTSVKNLKRVQTKMKSGG